MQVLDYINRLLGRPPILPNGYPDVAATVTRRINGGQQPRWNAPGGFFIPDPPPVIQQDYYLPTRNEPIENPMVSEIVNKIKTESVRTTPSSTSSLSTEYLTQWCGTTVYLSSEIVKEKKDPLVLNHEPLKRMLTKMFPCILDVTEVRIKPLGRLTHPIYENTIVYGPLEIHITVSPIHHSELMNPNIEKVFRKKLYSEMLPLITCMYENNSKDNPIIIFSPSHSETILEYVK